MAEVRSAIPFVQIRAGQPRLRGLRCDDCGATYIVDRRACGRCFGQKITEVTLSEKGRLYNYTIVHRSFPGIEVPFVSAIVDLEGGGSIRGNLIDVEPTPEAIAFDMPVSVVFRDCGKTDGSGDTFISHYFAPRREEA